MTPQQTMYEDTMNMTPAMRNLRSRRIATQLCGRCISTVERRIGGKLWRTMIIHGTIVWCQFRFGSAYAASTEDLTEYAPRSSK